MIPPPGYKFIPKTDVICGKAGDDHDHVDDFIILKVVLNVMIFFVNDVSLRIEE
jgi:hypothetical protein